MTDYARMYRFRITPWERYGTAAASNIATLLDHEDDERSRTLGRALDLGYGRGQYTLELVRRGWKAVGIDKVPAAIEAANRKGTSGATYVVGDVTDLPAADLGTFDFFLWPPAVWRRRSNGCESSREKVTWRTPLVGQDEGSHDRASR